MDEVPMIYGTAVIGYCVYQVSESMSPHARGIGACKGPYLNDVYTEGGGGVNKMQM